MNTSKIKVVKRSAIQPDIKVKKSKSDPRVAAREMVSTVTDWVAEVKQRKTEETKFAFETLFSANHQPRES